MTEGSGRMTEVRGQKSVQPLAWIAASLIEKETLKKRMSNNKCRMLKEGILSVFKKRVSEAIPSFDIRHSTFFGSAVRFLTLHSFTRATPLATSGQSDRKGNIEKANVEYRIMNVECGRNVFYLFYKKMTERPVGS
jgi:hypothetical protein